VSRRGSRECGVILLRELQVTRKDGRVGAFNSTCACPPLRLNWASASPDAWIVEAVRTLDHGEDSSPAE